jgi:hypoxanthine phosphoribosyltransferase
MTNKNVLIVDSVMGSGKTSWVIDYMNQHPEMIVFKVTVK